MSYRIIERGDTSKTCEYLYICSCGETKSLTFKISEEKPDKVSCDCGGELVRDFSGISFPFINGRLDPKSHNYWQKNMSVLEQAKVLANEREPY